MEYKLSIRILTYFKGGKNLIRIMSTWERKQVSIKMK